MNSRTLTERVRGGVAGYFLFEGLFVRFGIVYRLALLIDYQQGKFADTRLGPAVSLIGLTGAFEVLLAIWIFFGVQHSIMLAVCYVPLLPLYGTYRTIFIEHPEGAGEWLEYCLFLAGRMMVFLAVFWLLRRSKESPESTSDPDARTFADRVRGGISGYFLLTGIGPTWDALFHIRKMSGVTDGAIASIYFPLMLFLGLWYFLNKRCSFGLAISYSILVFILFIHVASGLSLRYNPGVLVFMTYCLALAALLLVIALLWVRRVEKRMGGIS